MTLPQKYKLAPPGAGLPWIELLIARSFFTFRRRTGSRSSFDAQFERERGLIGAMLQQCTPARGTQRVLISRIPGLEDSSRDWSVWMTLEHLRIVHGIFAHVIGALVKDATPPGETSIASVKPSPDVGTEVVAPFEASCDVLVSTVGSAPNLNTRARYSHPWFGSLDAAGWHALAGMHLAIHRKQIEHILAGLGN